MPPLTQPPHCPFRKGSGVFLLSLDGQPDGFIAGFGFDDLLFEFVEPLRNLSTIGEGADCEVNPEAFRALLYQELVEILLRLISDV